MAGRLTDAKVRSARPKVRPYKLPDGEGLFLWVTDTRKTWRRRVWVDGRESTFTLGEYPAMGLADARLAARDAGQLARTGRNPATARADERRANVEAEEARRRAEEATFGRVAAAWLDLKEREVTAPVWAGMDRRVTRYLLPALGRRPVEGIGPGDLRPLLRTATERISEGEAVQVKKHLSAIFAFAIAQGWVDANPTHALRGFVRPPKSRGKANLTATQLRAFHAWARTYRGRPETMACLRFIALTSCRPGEAAGAQWSEVDSDALAWRLPAARMKARREHTSPLSRQAVALLEAIRPLTGGGRYIFPGRGRSPHVAVETLDAAMRDAALGEGASPHCWRVTFSTWANEQGHGDTVERQLAHVEKDKVRAAYNRAGSLDARRELMQAWADYLDATQADNVVPMHRKGA